MDKSCFLKVGCMPQLGCKPLRLPMDYDSFAPFVIAKFVSSNGATTVTVGNESYKNRPNTAIIKSMEFGYMDKPIAKLEIVDEVGGELGLFVDAMRKCGNELITSTMELKFGWVKANCGGFGEEDLITFGKSVSMIIVEIEVAYGDGLVRYTIQGNALDAVTTNQREDNITSKAMRLTDAISRICASKGITPVFASVMADGSIKTLEGDWPQGLSEDKAPWEWNVGGFDGPRGSWQGDNNDVLSTISRWIEPYRAKSGSLGAGILMVFDSKKHNRLFLWMDPRQEKRCPEYTVSQSQADSVEGGKVTGGTKRGSLGTFIVNGGKCSPVIRFDPKINFISALAQKNTGGNAGSETTSNSIKPEEYDQKGPCPIDKNTGPENNATITQSAKENYPPNLVNRETLKSNMAHIRANMMGEFSIGTIQAELTTIGMPTDEFVDFKVFLFSPLSIIVINPFYLAGGFSGMPEGFRGMGNGCGDWSWLAGSGCNEVLSDKHYLCMGVNHSIKEGSYTTTLKVMNVNKNKAQYDLE